MKKDSPGCSVSGGECCGPPPSECWICPQPTAVSVTASNCCDFNWSGTYLLNSLVCETNFVGGSGTNSYVNTLVDSGGSCQRCTPVFGNTVGICDSFLRCEGGFGYEHILFMQRPQVRVLILEVAGIPTVQIRVRTTYTFYRGWGTSNPDCNLFNDPIGLFSAVTYEDNYERSFGDCNEVDTAEVTFVSRTRSFTHGSYFAIENYWGPWFESVNTDPSKVVFGDEDGTQEITVCPPATLALVV